jgi:hypothetical protein
MATNAPTRLLLTDSIQSPPLLFHRNREVERAQFSKDGRYTQTEFKA